MDSSLPFYAVAGHVLTVVGSLTLAATSLRSPTSLIDDLTVSYGGFPTEETVERAARRAGIAAFGFGCLALGLIPVAVAEFLASPPDRSALMWGVLAALVVGGVFGWRGVVSYRRAVAEARDRPTG